MTTQKADASQPRKIAFIEDKLVQNYTHAVHTHTHTNTLWEQKKLK